MRLSLTDSVLSSMSLSPDTDCFMFHLTMVGNGLRLSFTGESPKWWPEKSSLSSRKITRAALFSHRHPYCVHGFAHIARSLVHKEGFNIHVKYALTWGSGLSGLRFLETGFQAEKACCGGTLVLCLKMKSESMGSSHFS